MWGLEGPCAGWVLLIWNSATSVEPSPLSRSSGAGLLEGAREGQEGQSGMGPPELGSRRGLNWARCV